MFSQKHNSGVASTDQDRRSFSRPKEWFVGCLALLSVIAATFVLPPQLSVKAQSPRFTQIWSDEFNRAPHTGVNTAKWLYDTGTGYGWVNCPPQLGTGEIETMTNSTSNVYQDGSGHLAIKAINRNGTWTSGRIETTTSFAAPGGILAIEASIKLPNLSGAAASGYWPAFWMLGSGFRPDHVGWPKVGEIDIMENVNGMGAVFSTLHCGVAPGGPCNEFTGLGSGQHDIPSRPTAFHTYRVEIDRSVSPEQLRWYLDGTNFFTLKATQVDATTWSDAVDHPFFVILNLAIGGAFPAAFGYTSTASTQSGGAMVVDYVRVSATKCWKG